MGMKVNIVMMVVKHFTAMKLRVKNTHILMNLLASIKKPMNIYITTPNLTMLKP
jgi:hypothetical protein